MKAAVIIFPGSNCDIDARVALESLYKAKVYMIWHKDTALPSVDLIILPGGFSYGDYLRPGSIASKSQIINDIIKKGERGTPIIGICNGFQILTECNLLPGTLIRNANLKFVCKDTHLRVENNTSIFTSKYNTHEIIKIPIAHHDGNYFGSEDIIKNLEDSDKVIFRYCEKNGAISVKGNPNGSINNIAGIINQSGNILGLMPHPERAYDPLTGGKDGAKLFKSLIEKVVK